MHLIYVDDSCDEKKLYIFSALAVPADRWTSNFNIIKDWRQQLKQKHGIYARKELHAVDFVPGRGNVSPKVIGKWQRAQIFREGLELLVKNGDFRLFNACVAHNQERAFERLLNRINRTMQAWGSHALLICDAGKEAEYTKLARKMGAFNPIPSRYGAWEDGGRTKNIPIDRIIEDPIFKKSDRSYLIQMADFCAYALLQRERPIPSRMK